MARCGRISSPRIEELIKRALRTARELDGNLSFNWIRCYEGASGVTSRTIKVGKDRRVAHRIEEVRYDVQHDFYEEQWERDRESKLTALVDVYMTNDNLTQEEAQSKALWETATLATGGDACGFNSAASAFFFFTIMTTVGYGNQTPSTGLGRALIISFGFVGILMFGLILARAGRVVSAILDDFLGRVHPAFITRPWVSFLFWTGAYWGWMLVQAELYMRWKEGRLAEPFKFEDAFWFAFLTSTTIGLGDYFIDPEVIIVSDLLWIPAVILVGFLFFSAFLTKMIDVINMLRPAGERKDLIDEMLDQLISEANPKGEPTFIEVEDNINTPRNDESEVESAQRSRSFRELQSIDEELSHDVEAESA
ncbi:hypothetical protein FisN_13Lh275 [Fistulifera solaris]|uniref:Potassium channel domain-containing protein n=1 Tax=Fistulifera solaris TaxID=1519565 RepID=A0A1Z5KLI0_FISSO|nr:hypothetical protein FisN_13Lh275 [Fistulifera solaris]|eukprot:GAX27174.1 hypothetical protein FisN_13Lh275 [Fistulifera solaris]